MCDSVETIAARWTLSSSSQPRSVSRQIFQRSEDRTHLAALRMSKAVCCVCMRSLRSVLHRHACASALFETAAAVPFSRDFVHAGAQPHAFPLRPHNMATAAGAQAIVGTAVAAGAGAGAGSGAGAAPRKPVVPVFVSSHHRFDTMESCLSFLQSYKDGIDARASKLRASGREKVRRSSEQWVCAW